MLEDSSKFRFSIRAQKVLENSGRNGVNSFIEESLKPATFKRKNIAWGWKYHKLKQGEPVMWKGRLITPIKIDVSKVKHQSITDIDNGSK